ncbi:laminin subunit alpha-2-like [Liolophura sinensis]|uniref:laminin subunit alpha-2-like n=1 Tax=Liolophura sinensis TaxID=3198878 RepID=UPI003158BC44
MHANVIVVCFLFTTWINGVTAEEDERALYPIVANVARKATVTVNATCGEIQPEYYCRLMQGEFFNPWESQFCFVCDARSPEPSKKHPIENVIDGGEAFWQSPSLAHGMKYDYVTITLDLKQIYQVSYVNVEVGLSPRPGNWILEKSLDGSTFVPWQYFAISDPDCWLNYGTPPMIGRPKHLRDNQVICTSHFSRIDPLQNGTVFVSLMRGRTSSFSPSQTLINFISARYVRLRFQKLQKLNNDEIILMMNRPDDVDGAILRRYFYTVKEIAVGAQCQCHGHASRCSEDAISGEPLCECEHNTCGTTCEMCCPKYNQKPWQPASLDKQFICEECNCNGHSVECVYNETVAEDRLSYNMNNFRRGGGVCVNCRDNTEGINCERCVRGYYRPQGSSVSAPCRRCQCHQTGSTGECVQDDSHIQEGMYPGDCVCHKEYAGTRCDRCAPGYRDYPWCQRCPCNPAGSQNSDICEKCLCKANVEGQNCDRCLTGHFHLSADNPDGCSPCFCFGVTSQCDSVTWGKAMVNDMNDWIVQVDVLPNYHGYAPLEDGDWLVYEGPGVEGIEEDPLYWAAPTGYRGDKLYSYGGVLEFTILYETSGYSHETHHMSEPDVILQGEGLTIGKRGIYYREDQENKVTVNMTEQNWFERDNVTGYFYHPITKADFMMALSNLKSLLIRASYHTGQTVSKLKDVKLEVAMETAEASDEPMGSVEKCACPEGYTGMSCEKCEVGYRRVNNTLMRGECRRCDCHGHASHCDPVTGICQNCGDNTAGDHCERCRLGFYSNSTAGDRDRCKPCGCPLVAAFNKFAVDCVMKEDNSDYVCVGCHTGHVGLHCELCDDGFFGNPLVPGNYCKPCQCNNNIDLQAVGNCDTLTGECLKCLGNTEGFNCGQCKPGFFGTAVNRDCRACNCEETGSVGRECDQRSGQCVCKPHYSGRHCDQCEVGFGNVEAGCLPCNCSSTGSFHQVCDPKTGQCDCKDGVTGLSCDTCQDGHYGLSDSGCLECDCHAEGTNSSLSCDPSSGQCLCLPHITGQRCDECQDGFWNLTADTGCESCNCHRQGSWDSSCDPITGQCSCKDGVGGRNCSKCEQGYYSFSYKGCRACQPCKSKHHVCDPDTGNCVCPENTEGEQCQSCVSNTWGLHPVKGCKRCDCHKSGSVNSQCDQLTGQCLCKEDYTGQNCDRCQFGYYGFPSCRSCLCNQNGTLPTQCDGSGACQCDQTGACLCKQNVEGRRCNQCRAGHFGLLAENVNGCSKCFCFGKTDQCSQALYFWKKEYWVMEGQPSQSVSRPMLMAVLSDLEDVYILAAPSAYNYYVQLLGLSLEIATEDMSAGLSALGIELCQCPALYSGSSCQLPGSGFYRDSSQDSVDWSNLSNITLGMRLCECNNHSHHCDPYSGGCQSCSHHTTGAHCENCESGYYDNGPRNQPNFCERCACPLKMNSNNFSPTCYSYGEDYVCNNCSEGTTGQHCERCLPGFYGDPTVEGDRCHPCTCNIDGALSRTCDPVSGQCRCRPGLSGRSCDQCRPRHALIGGRCKPCDEGCTGILMAESDLLDVSLAEVLKVNLTDLPPPFLRAEHILNITRDLQVKLAAAEMAELFPLTDLIKDAEDNVTALLVWAEDAIKQGAQDSNNSALLITEATNTQSAVTELLVQLQGDIQSLDGLVEKLLLNGSGLNLTAALPQARSLLSLILNKTFKVYDKAANKEMGLAKDTLMNAKGLEKSEFNISALESSLKQLRDQLNNLQTLLNESAYGRLAADDLNLDSGIVYNKTKRIHSQLEGNLTDVNTLFDDSKFYKNEGERLVAEAVVDLESSEKKLDILRTASDQLDVKGEVISTELERSHQLVNQSWEHAYRLLELAQTLNRTFSGTRAEAADPLQAAGVYKNIVLAVENAREAANKAVEESEHSLSMAKNKSLQREVEESVRRSEELTEEEREIVKGISGLQDRLGDVTEDLVPVGRQLNSSEEEMRLIEGQKDKLGQGFPEKVKELDERILAVIQSANFTAIRADAKAAKVYQELIPFLLTVHPKTVLEKLGYINQTVESSHDHILRIENLTNWLNTKLDNITRLKSNLSNKILALKDKIKLARAEANNVKASLSASGSCVRSYRAPDHAGTTNTISFNFHTNSTGQDMLLLLVQNSPNEYLAVELKNGKVQFSWNVGGGPGRVIHPEPLEDTTGGSSSSERWYHVEVIRIGRLALLKVKALFGLQILSEDVELSGTSPPGFSLLTFGNSSQLYVAGVPADYQTPQGVSSQNFTGCIGDVFFNHQRIGLFNFRTSSEFCSACLQAPSVSPPVSGVYQFDGAGYAALPGFEPYSSTRYVISLEFRTVWENALLFLSANPDSGDYLSLELRDGRLMFQFYLGGNSLGILTSKRQYNINSWVSVTAGRQNLRGLLEVSVKSDSNNFETINGLALPGNKGLELMDRTLYFGGIPDSFYLPRAPYISRKKRQLSKRQIGSERSAIDVETSPFLGCMQNVQIGSRQLNPVDLLDGDSVGVTEGCRTVGERLVGFLGDGYMELMGYSLWKGSADVSLTFRTLYPEGVLLLATGQDQQHFYSLALVNGLLQARISGGSGVVVLTAEKNYTDGEPHNVALLKYDRNLELLVDDVLVEEGELPVGSGEIRVPTDSGLYIGGVHPGVDTLGKVGTSKGFRGCVSDIVINRGLLLLDHPVSYKLADIGRCSAAAMASIFAPIGVTRRPSVWPGLGTSQTGPFPSVTRSPVRGEITGGVSVGTTPRDSVGNITSPGMVSTSSTHVFPWLPPEASTTTMTRTSRRTTGAILPPWFVTKSSSVSPTSEDGPSSEGVQTEASTVKLPSTDDSLTSVVIFPGGTATVVHGSSDSVGTPSAKTTSPTFTKPFSPTFTKLTSSTSTKPFSSTATKPTYHTSTKPRSSTSTKPRLSTSTKLGTRTTDDKLPVSTTSPYTTTTRFTGVIWTDRPWTSPRSSPQYTDGQWSTGTAQHSTTTGYSVLIPGETTEDSTGEEGIATTAGLQPDVTVSSTEEVTSGEMPTSSGEEVNGTIVILPPGEGERETTQKPTDSGAVVEIPYSSTEPAPILPKTAPTQEFGTSGTTKEGAIVDGVSLKPSSEKPEVESTSITQVTPSKELTTPAILTDTISVTPEGTDETTSSSEIEPTSTSRIIILPTSEQPYSTLSSSTSTVPSVTIVGVTPETVSTPTTREITTPTTTAAPTSPPTTCAEGDEYGLEADSISFGNTPTSYAEIKVRRRAVRKDFEVTFDFRSFSPDGMFFYLTNAQQTHFVAGQLKAGQVVVTYNDRRGIPLRILTSQKYSDGNWHSVRIEKGLREISLEVDKGPVLRGGIPRRLNVTAPMYVGGLPREYKVRQGLVSHSVRGCLRRFIVNDGLFHLKNASVVSGVGPCYSKVERGAYFNGYSYGVFDQHFNLGRAMLIILSFRTHKPNGVLLTVSSYEGSPALALELHKGKLKFSMRGSAGVFSAESQYDTDFALCDQRWHVVKAEVIQRVITLRVDEGNVSYAFDQSATRPKESKHPLFIGGFPEYALPQAASFSQTNFEGCMKNLFINGLPVNWHTLLQSVEINKVSCPVL